MTGILIAIGVVVVVGLAILAWVAMTYNGLVSLRNRYKNAFAQIDVQLKRRYDLIPNLVEVAKGYMAHEKDTLEAVINARNQAFSAAEKAGQNPGEKGAMDDLVSADSNLNGALGRLLMIAESYPDLKANENMLSLQEELTSTENKVAFSRQAYNDSVTAFNTTAEQFPAVMIAGMLGFHHAELFEVETKEEKKAPKVEF